MKFQQTGHHGSSVKDQSIWAYTTISLIQDLVISSRTETNSSSITNQDKYQNCGGHKSAHYNHFFG